MKKVLSVILVLMLCLGMSAMAAESPNLTGIIATITAATSNDKVAVTIDQTTAGIEEVEDQIEKLKDSTLEEYYGADVAAKIDEITEGDEDSKLVAIFPVVISGYETEMGDIICTFDIPATAALEAGQKVAVAVGIPSGVVDGETVYEWTVFEGTADGNGKIEVTLDAETLAAVSTNGALVAIYA